MGIETAALLGYAATAATVVGTAVSVYSQQEAADKASALADQQRLTAQQDAQFAASEAELQAKQIRKAAERQRAEARAAIAGSGATVGTGTAEQIDTEIAQQAEQDALMAIYDGSNRSRAIRVAGNNAASRSEDQASAYRTGAATSALSGFATVARGWNTTGYKRGG